MTLFAGKAAVNSERRWVSRTSITLGASKYFTSLAGQAFDVTYQLRSQYMGMRYNRVKQFSGEVTSTVAWWLDTLPKRRMISISGNIFIQQPPNNLYILWRLLSFFCNL